MAVAKSAGPGKISIAEAMESLDATGEIFEFFYDRQTGDIVECPTEEALSYMEEDEYPEDERKLWDQIGEDESGKRFVKLPTQFEVNEWDIMQRFAGSLNNETQQRMLYEQIRGGGQFSRFKNAVERLGIEYAWNAFKEKALRDLMIEWCQEHGVEAID